MHLRNQGGVEPDVPAIDGNAEQKRQDDQHGQQRNGEQPETDGASAHRPVQGVPGIRHSMTRICGRWSCARCQAFARLPRGCRRSPSAPQECAGAPDRPGCRRRPAGHRFAVRQNRPGMRRGSACARSGCAIRALAGPVVTRQCGPHRGVDRNRRHAELRRELVHEDGGEFLHVVAAILQGRQMNLHDVQAIVQVGAKASSLYFLLQIGIGRKDKTQIDRDFTLRADGPDAAVFQNAQQLALHRQRQVRRFHRGTACRHARRGTGPRGRCRRR